jgi:hypothetical protein
MIISDKIIRALFFVGISSYSFGITYLYVAKYYFYITLLYLLFGIGSEKFTIYIWDSLIRSLLYGYYLSILNFVIVLGFLIYCHKMSFIDNWCKVYIPLLNQTFITIQYINGEYLFTFEEMTTSCYFPQIGGLLEKLYSWKSIYERYIQK